VQKLTLLVLYVGSAAVLIALSAPLIFRKIGPNRLYGFRTPSTLADRDLWYRVNASSGKRLAAAGVTIVAGAVAFWFVPQWSVDQYAIANLAVAVLAIIVAVVQSARDLQQFKAEKAIEGPSPNAPPPDAEPPDLESPDSESPDSQSPQPPI
jgi:hypothetical protein